MKKNKLISSLGQVSWLIIPFFVAKCTETLFTSDGWEDLYRSITFLFVLSLILTIICSMIVYIAEDAKVLKRLLYIERVPIQIDIGLLILRLTFGLLMMRYGWQEIGTYKELSNEEISFWEQDGVISLCFIIFIEFFCSIFVLLGCFTRYALIPLIIGMLISFFQISTNTPFYVKEHALVFLFPYIALLFAGAGRYSLDFMIFGNRLRSY